MPKYYRRKYYRGGRDKYSIEHNAFDLVTNTDGDGGQTIVPAATVQGMRKVKHITISMGTAAEASTVANVIYWAIVYVPGGTSPNTLVINGGSLYEPNQYVMGCGVFDFDGGPLRVHCPLSRNLNSGDSIALVCHTNGGQKSYQTVVSYAITLQ